MNQYVLLVLLALLALSSCKNDDDDGAMTRDDVVGTWTSTGFDVTLTSTLVGLDAGMATVTQIGGNPQITFLDDGTYTSSGTQEIMVTVDDSSYTEIFTGGDSGVWSLNGETFIFTSSDTSGGFTNALDLTPASYVVRSFSRGERFVFGAAIDTTQIDPFFGLTVRTMGDMEVTLEQ